MINPQFTTQLRDLLATIQTSLIILPAQPTFEQAVTACALLESLRLAGKEARLLCPVGSKDNQNLQMYSPILAPLEAATSEIGHQNLSISFEYDEAAVDKVSYHIGEESKRFYLTIKPRPGHPPLDTKSVDFSYTGAEADLVFLIGVQQLDTLDQLYFGYEELYRNSALVTINTFEPEFGLIKLDVSGAASQSELIAQLLMELELPLSSEIATYLLSGVESATDSFRSLSTTSHTFEIAAKLLQLGARRIKRELTTAHSVAVQNSGAQDMSASTEVSIAQDEDQNQGQQSLRKKSKADGAKKAGTKRKVAAGNSEPGSLKYQPSNSTSRG